MALGAGISKSPAFAATISMPIAFALENDCPCYSIACHSARRFYIFFSSRVGTVNRSDERIGLLKRVPCWESFSLTSIWMSHCYSLRQSRFPVSTRQTVHEKCSFCHVLDASVYAEQQLQSCFYLFHDCHGNLASTLGTTLSPVEAL